MRSFLLISILIINCFALNESEDEENKKIKTLCEDPEIHSADRLVNNTVRVYRGQYYWELIGLPAKTVKVEGPFKIWYLNMGTLSRSNAIVTVLEGNDKGSTYKTEDQRYWAWDNEGKQFAGAVKGNFWNLIPEGGFEAAFHDANKTNPTVVGFKGIKVYYFSTKDKIWSGDKMGYISGKFNENFPPDLTAAFSWPPDNPNDEYIAYLFKRKKFCKRTKILKSGQNCDEWVNNTILFGCSITTFQVSEEIVSEQSETNNLTVITSSGALPDSTTSALEVSSSSNKLDTTESIDTESPINLESQVPSDSPTASEKPLKSVSMRVCSQSLTIILFTICLNSILIYF